jgi:cell wall-associated NlpC family hydrolase
LIWILVLCLVAVACKSKKKATAESPAFTVIQTAKSYRGTPYKYGGTTRAGMDCSALVYHAYSSIGITLPRRSEDQSNLGEKVSLQEVKPGDLLFFATGKKRNTVTHSGIVTEVERSEIRFIHSSTSLGVTEDYLSTRYWSDAFLFAKRLVN